MPTVWGRLSQATLRLAGAEASAWATSRVLQTFSDSFLNCHWNTNYLPQFSHLSRGQITLSSSHEKTEDGTDQNRLADHPPDTYKTLPRVHFPTLTEATADKAMRRAAVWDLPGYPGVFRALAVTENGCHQQQQMFKSLHLMKTGNAHFLAVFPP